MARPVIHALIAVLMIGISCVGEAARLGSRSSSAVTSAVGKKAVIREEVAAEAGKSVGVKVFSGSASTSSSGSSPAAAAAKGSAIGAAAVAAGAATAEEKQQSEEERQNRQVELGKSADEKRKAEEERKHAEINRLAKEAEDERQRELVRIAQEKKKREEQQRLQAQFERERRCVLKPVMSDAEIAKCR